MSVIRIPLFRSNGKKINLLITTWFHVRSSIEFDLKKPKELLRFHFETGIKNVKTFVFFFIGWESIELFSIPEQSALVTLIKNATEVIKHEVLMDE